MKNLSVILSLLVLLVVILNISTTNDRIKKLETLSEEQESEIEEQDLVYSADEREIEAMADVQSERMPAISLEIPTGLSFAGEPVPLELPAWYPIAVEEAPVLVLDIAK